MSASANSGPAIMMMPPHIRATFMPNPPIKHIVPNKPKRRQQWNGVADLIVQFERTPPPIKKKEKTPKELKERKVQKQKQDHVKELEPKIEAYRKEQRDSGGEYEGMNCYNTLFVGRLAYEVTERKLLREMETFGAVKDLKLISDKENKSRGYAFVEYEHEEDMKRAFREADGMRIEGREIVVDVERGHTVPNWLPRRLGGGLGGTRFVKYCVHCVTSILIVMITHIVESLHGRLGDKDKNVTFPGRFDPSRPEPSRPPMGPSGGIGRGSGQPPPYGGGYGGGRPFNDGYGGGFVGGGGPPPPYGRGRGGGDRYGGPPPRGAWERDRGGGGGGRPDYDRKRYRSRSRSPDRRHSRRRY